MKDSDLFDEAKKRNKAILDDPKVATISDEFGWTPLHWLARNGVIEALSHPLVATVRTEDGDTSLHFLALARVKEVLFHPMVDKVENNYHQTPLHVLGKEKLITRTDLEQKYPWIEIFPFHKINSEEFIDEIVNTSSAGRFILGITK